MSDFQQCFSYRCLLLPGTSVPNKCYEIIQCGNGCCNSLPISSEIWEVQINFCVLLLIFCLVYSGGLCQLTLDGLHLFIWSRSHVFSLDWLPTKVLRRWWKDGHHPKMCA